MSKQIDLSRVRISPSLIASDLSVMGSTVAAFSPDAVDLLHMDVMDGHFVPNMTFGPGYILDIKKHSEIPLDVHLMIERPELSIDQYLKAEPWCVTIHYESTRFPARLMNLIGESGAVPGIALNPATPVEAVYDLLPYCGMVLIMSVDPGFYGQSFMEPAIERISRVARFIRENSLDVAIQVDGGISASNIVRVAAAGARIFVAGNAVFKGGDPNKNALHLKELCRTVCS